MIDSPMSCPVHCLSQQANDAEWRGGDPLLAQEVDWGLPLFQGEVAVNLEVLPMGRQPGRKLMS